MLAMDATPEPASIESIFLECVPVLHDLRNSNKSNESNEINE
jgi:hypothetical protein